MESASKASNVPRQDTRGEHDICTNGENVPKKKKKTTSN